MTMMMMINLCASKRAGGAPMKTADSMESLYPPDSDREQPAIRRPIPTITGDRAPPTPCANKTNHSYVNVKARPPPTAKKPHVNVAMTDSRAPAATDNYVTYQNLKRPAPNQ